MSRLIPCAVCTRHVRARGESCPFCGAAIVPGPAPRAPDPLLSRAAQLAFGVVLVGAATARCGPPPTPDAGTDLARHQPDASIGTEADASERSSPLGDAAIDVVEDVPSFVAIYGDPTIRITQYVSFKLGEAKLDKDDLALLDAVAEALKAHPELELIEVEGHAAKVEKAALAAKRAQLVVDQLAKLGIDPRRLVVRDYGRSRPLDTRHEANARVGFRVEAPK